MSLIRTYKATSRLWQYRPVTCIPTRSFSASSTRSGAFPPVIYISESVDPHFNLAFEDWIFRKTDASQVILYMYRNTPSVIIGRNQNPWKEINLHKLNALSIPFVRRKSGGGTVYHDLGNTNYCVFVPRNIFERRINAELVARALADLDVPAYVNDRNDICVEGFKMSCTSPQMANPQLTYVALHVSGSAFKLVNARAYHHGTMLISAKLTDLKGVLGNDKGDALITKGVASVPSPVKNLRHWSSTIDHDAFVGAVAAQFGRQQGSEDVKMIRIDESELESNQYVRDTVRELKSWDWAYGQTPEFTHTLSTTSLPSSTSTLKCTISSRHALITSVEFENPTHHLRTLEEKLVGLRYESLEGLDEGALSGEERHVVDWLKEEM